MLVTGSFDATAGIWRRWNEGAIEEAVAHNEDDYPEEGEEGGARGKSKSTQGDTTEEGDDGDDEEEEDGWRFAVILEGHDSEIKSVAWSASGTFLATCSRDKSVWIWEEIEQGPGPGGGGGGGGFIGGGGGGGAGDDDFETVAVLQDHEADVKCVVWHPSEDLLASASYDETIRLYREEDGEDDWICVAVLRGHDGTVWALDFEGIDLRRPGRTTSSFTANQSTDVGDGMKVCREDEEEEEERRHEREEIDPRLISCSDDLTIRVWKRNPRQSDGNPGEVESGAWSGRQKKYPSTIRPSRHTYEEDWIEQSVLPKRHDRAIYSVAWSSRTGRVASTGGDGKIVVYEERRVENDQHDEDADEKNGNGDRGDESNTKQMHEPMEDIEKENERQGDLDTDVDMADDKFEEEGKKRHDNAQGQNGVEWNTERKKKCRTEWVVVAETEAGHGAHEINHVCWSKRFDRGKRARGNEQLGERYDDDDEGGRIEGGAHQARKEEEEEEEVVISTGDDGVVNVWTLSLSSA